LSVILTSNVHQIGITPGANEEKKCRALGQMGEIFEEIGDFPQAIKVYHQFSSSVVKNGNEDPKSEVYKKMLAISFEKLGTLHISMNEKDSGVYYLEKYRELIDHIYKIDNKNLAYKKYYLRYYERMGDFLYSLGQLDTSLIMYINYNNLCESVYYIDSLSIDSKRMLAISYERLGTIYMEMGNIDLSYYNYLKYNKLSQMFYDKNPGNENLKNALAISFEKLGIFYFQTQQYDTALIYFCKELNLAEPLANENPKSERFNNGLAFSNYYIGKVYQAKGQIDSALFFLEKEFLITKKIYENNPYNEILKYNLSVSFLEMGNLHFDIDSFDKSQFFYANYNILCKEIYENSPENEKNKSSLISSYDLLIKIYKKKQLLIKDNYIDKIIIQEKIIHCLNSKIKLENIFSDKLNIEFACAQGDISKYYLFSKRFTDAEFAAKEALIYAPDECKLVSTTLTLAILCQGKYKKSKVIYRRYSGKSSVEKHRWINTFNSDLDKLEKSGITHPDYARFKKFIEK
jgi:tetratricopeptide (TPR) repeat protein